MPPAARAVVYPQLLDDGFGGSVVGTFRVGEAGGVEAMLDQVLAVVADLLDLGGVGPSSS